MIRPPLREPRASLARIADMTKRIIAVVAVAALLAGAVFALQGLRVLPSQLMYGRPEWIVIGVALMIVSGATLARLRKGRAPVS